MRRDITRYVISCSCQGLKRRLPEIALSDTHLQSTWPNDLVMLDCAGPLPLTTNGNKYIVLLQDAFTKYSEAASVPRITSSVIADVILRQWILRYGPMRRLLTDNGSEFRNELVIKGLCELCDVEKLFTTAYHPQSNGMVERLVRTVKSLLTAQLDSVPGQWDDRISFVLFAYNNTLHSETGEIPYYLWFGRPPVALSSLLTTPSDLPTSTSTQDYRDHLWRNLATAFELVRDQHAQDHRRTTARRALR